MLTRDMILEADDLKTETVKVPEWGGEVRVRMMTAADRDVYEQRLFQSREGGTIKNIRATLAAMCLVDDEGGRMFNEDDIEILGRKSASALNRVFEAAQRLNRITDDDLEELQGN